jgi:hypothetical protein
MWAGMISGLVLGLYVCGYFALADSADYGLFTTRTFKFRAAAHAYIPMGIIESKSRGREIIFNMSHEGNQTISISFE